MYFLKRLLTWWNSQTLGTQIYTARKGQKVGEDEQGNIYYQTADSKRRWVIYNGESEASRVSPDWHGWLHHRVDTPPSKEEYQPRDWQLPHKGNQTGTAGAYRPQGSTLASGKRPEATGDYKPWTPGN